MLRPFGRCNDATHVTYVTIYIQRAQNNSQGRVCRVGGALLPPRSGAGHVAGAAEHRAQSARVAGYHAVCLCRHGAGGLCLAADLRRHGRPSGLAGESPARPGAGHRGHHGAGQHRHQAGLESLAGARGDSTPGALLVADVQHCLHDCLRPPGGWPEGVRPHPRDGHAGLDERLLGGQRAGSRHLPAGRLQRRGRCGCWWPGSPSSCRRWRRPRRRCI